MSRNTEAIYDEQIAPLMERVIRICQAHAIPVAASFDLVTADGEAIGCATVLPGEDASAEMLALQAAIHRGVRLGGVIT